VVNPAPRLLYLRVVLVLAGIIVVQAIKAPRKHGHLWGDIPTLAIVAVALAMLTPRGEAAELARTAG
jgi:hypothetical protein